MHTFPFIHVIGLIGLKAAGKDEMCNHLAARGYASMRLSDAVRHAMKTEIGNDSPSVMEMIEFSNRKKKESGLDGIWARETLHLAAQRGHRLVLLNGIRNPGEIEVMRTAARNVIDLVGITAPTAVRYERATKRKQSGDPSELLKWLAMDDRDRGIGEPSNGQHVDRCMATVPLENVYNNVGTLAEFQRWADDTASRLYAKTAVHIE